MREGDAARARLEHKDRGEATPEELLAHGSGFRLLCHLRSAPTAAAGAAATAAALPLRLLWLAWPVLPKQVENTALAGGSTAAHVNLTWDPTRFRGGCVDIGVAEFVEDDLGKAEGVVAAAVALLSDVLGVGVEEIARGVVQHTSHCCYYASRHGDLRFSCHGACGLEPEQMRRRFLTPGSEIFFLIFFLVSQYARCAISVQASSIFNFQGDFTPTHPCAMLVSSGGSSADFS